MIDSLSRGSYLPSTRQDLINIATSCDKIANKCETVAKQIILYRFIFPAEFAADFNEIYDITEKQFGLLEQSVDMLFSKMNALQKDASILDEIRSLETQIDIIEYRISERIFAGDGELASKMMFVSIVELLCDISDIIEDIADKIQIMLIARKA
jgi:predicted phosphate transport protein (TIGR00153 family)